ncbi:hypothetical protein AMS68_005683 [Peltaster fructicola]|uniref:Ribosomal protein S2 n=1 Tax=Peltaster fructicola TaxID=286661 RepID=A0A6H0XZQ7_9PEZI|nr:hypothetical protein AMS68_005683 [Peltaster fructicola]
MITRSLALRHGRSAIARPATTISIRQWRRTLSNTTRRTAQAAEPADIHESHDKITADWEFFQHQRALTGNVGAKITPHYKPNNLVKRPPRPEDITLELLLASQTHLGHRTSLWHPANARYIFGTWGQAHDAIHVISLDVTASHLRRACKIVSGVAAKGGIILFVGTRDGQALPVVRAAAMAGGCHLFDKWIPGTLTNSQQILGKCAKKVVNELDEDLLGFESQLPQRAALKPDLVVCLNPLENYILLHECGQHNIPTIGIIDTDVNPTWVTYPIPANDDSLRSVSVIAGALGQAGEAGQRLRLERANAGAIDFSPAQGLRVPTKDEIQASKRLKSRSALEDRDEDEDDDVLTPEEVALYAQEAPTEQLAASRQENDDTEQLFYENDEALTDLTGISQEQNASQSLSQQEIDLLEHSLRHNTSEAAANDAPVEETTKYTDAVNHSEEANVASEQNAGQGEKPSLKAYEDAFFTKEEEQPEPINKSPAQLTEEEEIELLAESTQHPTSEEIRAAHERFHETAGGNGTSSNESTQKPRPAEADSTTPATQTQTQGLSANEDQQRLSAHRRKSASPGKIRSMGARRSLQHEIHKLGVTATSQRSITASLTLHVSQHIVHHNPQM